MAQCRQLSADCEYLCNVLTSLDCDVPVELMAWSAMLASADDEAGARAIAESLAADPRAASVAQRVLKIRFSDGTVS